jgi:alkylation response protein AidB-like acyl-CoA dehydrogenase
MDLRFTEEERAFRKQVRAFMKDALPPAIRETMLAGRRPTKQQIVTWQRILNAKGWAVIHWPKEYGGPGWSPVQRYIFLEEMYRAPAPETLGFNTGMIGPVIYTFGSDEQKRFFLPRLRNLDVWFCQGYSEPGAGSDLASLKTTAQREGDHYVVNGQKTWTSAGHEADWMFCLVRTASGTKKQQGISFLLIDMKTPGITVRPIISLIGHREQNEVFFDNVRVPVANLVHEENRGWDVAKFLLSNERMGAARVGIAKMLAQRARTLAAKVETRDGTLAEERGFREKLAALEVETKALEMMMLRALADASKHSDSVKPDPAWSMIKIKSADVRQALSEMLMQLAGPQAAPFLPDAQEGEELSSAPEAGWAATLAPNYFFWRAMSIYGGTNEVQRNIIAKAFLGL